MLFLSLLGSSTLLALCAAPAHAIHETVFAANAADAADNRLLSNPPLPMLRYSPGKWNLGLSPYYFTAKQDFTDQSPSGAFNQRGDYKGWGLGGSASWAFAERWGLYVFGVGSRVTGSNLFYNGAASNPAANNLQVLDAGANTVSLSGGIVYQFFGAAESGFVLPVFAGPLLKRYSFSHRVIETRQTGALTSDYDISGDGIIPGLLVGAQAAIGIGKGWQLNPFLIIGQLLTEEIEVDVTKVRANTEPNNNQQNVNRLLRGEQPEGNSMFGGIGLNLVYRPWSVSVNLSSPFMPALIGHDNLDMTMFSLSKAFGPGR